MRRSGWRAAQRGEGRAEPGERDRARTQEVDRTLRRGGRARVSAFSPQPRAQGCYAELQQQEQQYLVSVRYTSAASKSALLLRLSRSSCSALIEPTKPVTAAPPCSLTIVGASGRNDGEPPQPGEGDEADDDSRRDERKSSTRLAMSRTGKRATTRKMILRGVSSLSVENRAGRACGRATHHFSPRPRPVAILISLAPSFKSSATSSKKRCDHVTSPRALSRAALVRISRFQSGVRRMEKETPAGVGLSESVGEAWKGSCRRLVVAGGSTW